MCNLNEAIEKQIKENKKIRNQQILYVTMFIIGMLFVLCSCKKEVIIPTPQPVVTTHIMEANASNDDLAVDITSDNSSGHYNVINSSNTIEFVAQKGDSISLSVPGDEIFTFKLFMDESQVTLIKIQPNLYYYIIK